MDDELEIEIAPEPASAVRAAIVAAVEQLDEERRDSAWWRAGVAEAVSPELE